MITSITNIHWEMCIYVLIFHCIFSSSLISNILLHTYYIYCRIILLRNIRQPKYILESIKYQKVHYFLWFYWSPKLGGLYVSEWDSLSHNRLTFFSSCMVPAAESFSYARIRALNQILQTSTYFNNIPASLFVRTCFCFHVSDGSKTKKKYGEPSFWNPSSLLHHSFFFQAL